jgi:acetate kinase
MAFLLVINGGSSSIKFAVYDSADVRRVLWGQVERVGQEGTALSAKGLGGDVDGQKLNAGDSAAATGELIDWLRGRLGDRKIDAIGHRVVHGGFHLAEHQIISSETLTQLKQAADLDPAHLPREIALIEAFAKAFAGVPQVACFDTAFFKDLPILSKLLAIPRSYFQKGIHRFGFHGLSYTYLMQQLKQLDPGAAQGKIILAHLGSGASMAALQGAKPIDTSMSFTPTAGLVMGTRSGDLDPGLLVYLLRNEKLTVDQLDELLNKKSGLLGVSESSADMRDLVDRQGSDSRAQQAVDLFCYQAKKWIGGFAAAMGGVETIIFAGGIGEHSAATRAGICRGLEFLGIELDPGRNEKNAPVISAGRVLVRVIETDEEIVIAQTSLELTQAKHGPPNPGR